VEKPAFPILLGTAIRDEVAEAIRKAIASGRLRPGQRLIESKISEEFGVSRAPLREAFCQLESEGLVISRPRRGTYVRELSHSDAWEIYSLRAALEGLAVSLVASSADSDTIEGLRSYIRTMKACAAEDDVARLAEIDFQLHEHLCRSAGHKRLLEAWLAMIGQIRAFVSVADMSYLSPKEVVRRHEAVVDAIALHLPGEAQKLITDDIMLVGQYVARVLQEQGE